MADGLIACVLIGSVAPLGTVGLGAWAGALLLSLAAWALAASSPTARTHPLLATGLALWGAALALALVPVPPTLLEVLSPAAAELRGGGPAGTRAWAPLHLAPGPGGFRLLRWAAVVALVGACAARAGSSSFRRRVPNMLSAALVFGVALTVAQTTLGERQVLGVLSVRWDVRGALLTPLVNENHVAAWAALLAPITVFARGPVGWRVIAAAHGVVALAWVALGPSGSGRAGLIGFVFAAALLAGREHAPRLVAAGVVLGTAALGLLVGVATAGSWTGGAAEAHPLGKVSAWPDVVRLVGEYPWTGTGAGAFADAFSGVRSSTRGDWMIHAESLPLQVLADHGVLVGGALLLLLGAGLTAMGRENGSTERWVGTAALCGLVAHEMFDFATHTGAVLLPAAALATRLLGRESARRGARRRHLTAGIAVLGLVATASPLLRDWRVESLQRRLVAEYDDWDAVAEAMHRARPGCFVAAQEVGVGYARQDRAEAAAWMARAQTLAPNHPTPRLWSARVLRRMGSRNQALVEYRAVLDRDWRYMGAEVVAEVRRRYPEDDAFVRLAGVEDPVRAARVAWALFQAKDPRAEGVAEVAGSAHPFAALTLARTRILQGRRAEARSLVEEALGDPRVTPWLRARLLEHRTLAEGDDR